MATGVLLSGVLPNVTLAQQGPPAPNMSTSNWQASPANFEHVNNPVDWSANVDVKNEETIKSIEAVVEVMLQKWDTTQEDWVNVWTDWVAGDDVVISPGQTATVTTSKDDDTLPVGPKLRWRVKVSAVFWNEDFSGTAEETQNSTPFWVDS